MRGRLVALGISLVVLGAVVSSRGISTSSADTTQQDALIGQWKAADANDSTVLVFNADGSWTLSDGAVTVFSGDYAWNSESSVQLNFIRGGERKFLVWRIRVVGDVLQVVEKPDKLVKWFRVNESRRPRAPRRAPRVDVDVPDVTATAPRLMTGTSDLGRPCDANFRLISGSGGASLYKKQEGSTASSTVNQDFLQVTDTTFLQANASGWGLEGSIGQFRERRYLRYRAYQTTEVFQVDDATDPLHEPPRNAVWYVAAIIKGRSVEVVVSGNKTNFHAGLKAKLAFVGASLNSINAQDKLDVQFRGRGVTGANDRAIFAKTFDEIKAVYQQDTPVPIYVVYRHIPGAAAPRPENLPWAVEDDVKVETQPVACSCVHDQVVIDVTCRIRNHGGRSMDVTFNAHALTGTWSKVADAVGRATVAPDGKPHDFVVRAPLRAQFTCDSTKDCSCTLTDLNPTQ